MPPVELRTVPTGKGSQVIQPARRVEGILRVPGDKSIAHRALILGALAQGQSLIAGLPDSEDVHATVGCLRALGVNLRREDSSMRIVGAGLGSFATPHGQLDCENSGTTMRLLLGVLAGSSVSATLDGDTSLRRRPMARVVEPLQKMGARIESNDGRAPLSVTGTSLQGRYHALPVPSAQVKSALLLAGLSARGPTTVVEPVSSRDHTERMLRAMGTEILTRVGSVEVRPAHQPLRPIQLMIPGDVSSAAFWMAAAALRPGWSVTILDVGLNPTRTAFLEMLRSMGAEVTVSQESEAEFEPRGSATVIGRSLRSASLTAVESARAIDELPALLVVATQAHGTTTVGGAAELRLKESDRITAMSEGLRRMGANVEERPDGVVIIGPTALHGAVVGSYGDHRIAMALSIAALIAAGETTIEDADCVAVSYPDFFTQLRQVANA